MPKYVQVTKDSLTGQYRVSVTDNMNFWTAIFHGSKRQSELIAKAFAKVGYSWW